MKMQGIISFQMLQQKHQNLPIENKAEVQKFETKVCVNENYC